MDIVRRLATSQARGERQLEFVNELLSFRRVPLGYRDIPGFPGSTAVIFGLSKLPAASFRNLRKRLINVGFVVVIDWESGDVRMTFPEANLGS